MSIEQVEAGLSEAARQERRTVGSAAMEGRFKTVGVDHVKVPLSGGAVVDIEIARVDTVDHKALGRPTDKNYESSRNMVMGRLEMTGWATATVISCLPMLLSSDSTMEPLRKARVQPVKDSEDFSFLVFTNPHLEPAQIGPDAPKACYDFQPIQLAKEFERVFESHGGVIAFIGSPEDAKSPTWPHRAAWEQKRLKAIEWMEQMHREAQGFVDMKMFYGVRETHRACIRRLHSLGHLKTLPDWLEKKNDTAVEYPICPKCQQRQESPHVVECQRCKWVLDPRRAYEVQAIDESSPHLERLTRATVTEMGISDYVAETVDEKPARLKAGLPKPKSAAVMRQLEAQDKIEEEARNADAERIGKAIAASSGIKGKGNGKGEDAK